MYQFVLIIMISFTCLQYGCSGAINDHAVQDSLVIRTYLMKHLPDTTKYKSAGFSVWESSPNQRVIEHKFSSTDSLLIPPTDKLFFFIGKDGRIFKVMTEPEYYDYLYRKDLD